MSNRYTEIASNPHTIELNQIPVHHYNDFFQIVSDLIASENNHCIQYFAIPDNKGLKFICCIADDLNNKIYILSHLQDKQDQISLDSLTGKHFMFHGFEREISENYGVEFKGHPWLKPVRYSHYRADKTKSIENYPFFDIASEELHEVGVGPVHAGIIEPGYFRFICNGEQVLHLEIQLGYQHRGIEQLFVKKKQILQKSVLSESIAGDTTIGHSLCHNGLMESLGGLDVAERLGYERIIALELERIAVHIGDTSAICADIAYQMGQVVNEALRTLVINSTQLWCGNRFGKGMIRPGGSHYPLTSDLIKQIQKNLDDVHVRYTHMIDYFFTMPSVLARLEGIGKVTLEQANSLGAVGMAARSSGLKRDIRWSHPYSGFTKYALHPEVLTKGDVWSRAMLRKLEIDASVKVITDLFKIIGDLPFSPEPAYNFKLQPSSLAISLTEGWRGEICHTAITDKNGEIVHYKVKDPSFHNWMALALAVRNQEISDFPLCNKSYNLSYCGHDL